MDLNERGGGEELGVEEEETIIKIYYTRKIILYKRGKRKENVLSFLIGNNRRFIFRTA